MKKKAFMIFIFILTVVFLSLLYFEISKESDDNGLIINNDEEEGENGPPENSIDQIDKGSSNEFALPEGAYIDEIVLCNLDEDPNPEVFGYGDMHVYAWDHNGTNLWSVNISGGSWYPPYDMEVIDIDQDGIDDILIADGYSNITALSGCGYILWKYTHPAQHGYINTADIDLDGGYEFFIHLPGKTAILNDEGAEIGSFSSSNYRIFDITGDERPEILAYDIDWVEGEDQYTFRVLDSQLNPIY